VGKKIKALMDKMRPQFVAGMVKNGYEEKLGKELFDLFEAFAQYGFNKAHAACYALIAYQTAYLKAHYPSAFMAALMTAEQENLDKLTNAIKDAESLQINVLPPDVNESFGGFAVAPDKQSVRFGLNAIKNLGKNAVEAIVKSRKADGPYDSITNFLSRMPEGTMNRKSLESLIKAGALDSLADRGQMLAGLETMTRFAAARAEDARRGQSSLFGDTMPEETITLPPAGEVDPRQKLDWERELLGMYVSEHPLSAYSHLMQKFPSLADVVRARDNQAVTFAGLVSLAKKITTRKGDPMAFVTLEDQHSQIEVIVFPTLYQKELALLEPGTLLQVKGKISQKDAEVKVLADSLSILSEASVPAEVRPLELPPQTSAEPGLSEDLAAAGSAEDLAASAAEESEDESLVSPSSDPPLAEPVVPTAEPAPSAAANPEVPSSETVTIELSPQTTLETLEKIRDVLTDHRGESPVCLVVPRHGSTKRLVLLQGVRHSKDLVEALRAIDHEATIAVG